VNQVLFLWRNLVPNIISAYNEHHFELTLHKAQLHTEHHMTPTTYPMCINAR